MKISDKRRLDWLDKQDGAIGDQGYGDYREYFGGPFATARETIDKMIEAERKRMRATSVPE